MKEQLKQINLYTDGACSNNPGPGGWGAILEYHGTKKEFSGGERATTNNRMELTAVISGLSAVKERCAITVYTDSKYIVDAVNQGWAKKWRSNNWSRGKSGPALNPDLWETLLNLLEQHLVTFIWIKGHAGHPENERCDELAVAQTAKYK